MAVDWETRAEEAEARVRELEAERDQARADTHCRYLMQQEAEQKLADANALLAWLEHAVLYIDSEAARKVRAHLAAQPAAPSRTEAERAVLDAMAEVSVDGLHYWRLEGTVWQSNVAVAELARRGLK